MELSIAKLHQVTTLPFRATSSDTSFSVQTFTIAVGDVDEFNVGSVTDTNAAVDTIAENAAIGTTVGITASAADADATTNTIIYSLFDDDGGNFTIDSTTGVVTNAQLLNRETLTATRTITVRATSADGSFTDQSYTIALTDEDEFNVTAPVDSDTTANAVNENAAIGTVVGITASASDADSTNNGITYTLFDDDGGNFTIDSNTGVVTTAQALNRESLTGLRTITVRATSADGSTADNTFNITLNDIDEFDVTVPTDANVAANEVNENAAIGTTVGVTANAFDSDSTTNTITYTLTSNPDGLFRSTQIQASSPLPLLSTAKCMEQPAR